MPLQPTNQIRVKQLLSVLKVMYSKSFTWHRPVPLAKGMHIEIKKEFPKASLKVIYSLLRFWTKRKMYHWKVKQEGAVRYHLDGTVSEPVTPEEAKHARRELLFLWKCCQHKKIMLDKTQK